MTEWLAILIALTVIQIQLYQFSPKSLARISFTYGSIVCLGLFVSGVTRNIFIKIGLEWWVNVIIPFIGYVLGEFFSLIFRDVLKEIGKKKQVLPSFFSFSLMYLMPAWLFFEDHFLFSFSEPFILIPVLSLVSVFLLFVLSGIKERLLLVDLPKEMEGLPILLISAALLLMAISEPVHF